MWNQVYNPLGNAVVSTSVAAVPVVTLLALVATNVVKAHIAVPIGLAAACAFAIFAFTTGRLRPARRRVVGRCHRVVAIGWIIVVLEVIVLDRPPLRSNGGGRGRGKLLRLCSAAGEQTALA